MDLFDWIDLLKGERRLASIGQGWMIDDQKCIRNRRGQCPLCAWAELQGGEVHTLAWTLALRSVFGEDVSFGDAGILADTADNVIDCIAVFFARGLLLNFLNLKEPS